MYYFYIDNLYKVMKARWKDDFFLCFKRKLNGNYFKNEKMAKKALKEIKKVLASLSPPAPRSGR